MIWDLLGMVNGKTLLVAIIIAVGCFLYTIRPNKEDR